jgi:hypothetical protein
MKNLLLLVLFTTLSLNAQTKDCLYDIEEKTDSTSLKTLPHKLMNEKIFGNNKEFIFFGLLNNDGVPMLSLQQLQKSNDFIPTSCLSKNSKIVFQLINGKIVTLIHAFEDVCSDLNYNTDEKNNIRILTAYFYFTKNNFEELKNSPISLVRIQFSGASKDYVIKTELTSESLKIKTNPSNYFMEFLKCVE